MNPVGAAVVWHAERARIGNAAAADVVGGFDQHELSAGGRDPARGGDPGSAGADDHDIKGGGRRRDGAGRGACRQCG